MRTAINPRYGLRTIAAPQFNPVFCTSLVVAYITA